jgi:hypothetical protein
VKSDLLVSSFFARAAAVSKVKLDEPELPEFRLDLNAEVSPLEPEEYLLPEFPL